jgi:homoserine O-succinyltransferase|tara:strand:- start:39 stop:1100 length:1062 start_codon:yes stop_codon:yes gene_type:complete
MPIVANTGLPSFERFHREGGDVLSLERAGAQDIREMHIGLMNNMPDAALEPTERQFLRLVGGCNRIAQFHVYPFSPPDVSRGEAARAHIEKYYYDFEQLREEGLDALIVTGANPVCDQLPDEAFWNPMCEVLDWAVEQVTSTLCACLATHAAFLHFHEIGRQPLPAKRWGVFPHRVVMEHPLVRGINTRFDVPHSRWNDISAKEMNRVDQLVLVESPDAGVHLATSADGLRLVFFQGHPEYDSFSLLKEYKREVTRFLSGELDIYPSFPENYFTEEVYPVLDSFRKEAELARKQNTTARPFPEQDVPVDNTWGDTGKIVFNNWLGAIYQLTDRDRRKPFMPGVDPQDPLASIF